MIRIINLHKSFNNKPVLKGVNLEIYDGETVTIMGGSGQGKTVLLKNIIGLMKPDKGKIIIDGIDITTADKKTLHNVQKKFGYLFQGSALFDSMTVYENIAFGLRHMKLSAAEIKERVKLYLSYVGLEGIENMYPSELSGGMKKRVALARAVAYSPQYILYDEPTTGLDPQTAETITDLIMSLQKKLNVTSIVVTHDLKAALKVSQRIAFLYNGEIIDIEQPDKLLNTSNLFLREFVTSALINQTNYN
ncbi:MAG: ATP-binding cassette domain-containing protein [Endomicrobia bacterium]|nr:ATP-binding cassette domain-containing protein [Endomicrobiia bacterium]